MVEGTFVSKPNTRSGKSHSLNLPFDVPLLLIVVVILIFGLLMLYSASWDFSLRNWGDPTFIFNRQIRWILLGLVSGTVISFIDYHWFRKVLIPAGLATLGLLFAVLIVNRGDTVEGGRNLLGGSIQPSELAKAMIVIYLSFWLFKHKETFNNLKLGLIPLGIILGATAALIAMQPDLSAALTVLILGVVMFFIAGGNWKIILIVFALALLVGGPLVYLYPTGRARISSYIISLNDPLQSSYHIQRSLEAVVKGGWFGVGIGQAETKFTGLPLAPTDSIFAVIAEETGIIGGLFLTVLFVLFIWRGFVIAKNAPDHLGSMLAYGLTFWIGIEALMNIAVIVGLMPFTGNALPLVSAGGSSMLVTLTAIGIILNVSKASVKHQTEERSTRSAVVDLRGRNGRGRVSRRNRS